MSSQKPTIELYTKGYINMGLSVEVNLPGTGDTMIKKVVPSGRGQCIAPRLAEACDLPKRGRLGCVIFVSGGLRSRIPHTLQIEIIVLWLSVGLRDRYTTILDTLRVSTSKASNL